MKKFWAIGLSLFVIIAVGALIIIDDVDIRMSEATVQQAIDAKIAKGAISSRGVDFLVKKAVIDFKADNTASIDIAFDADGYSYSGSVIGDFETGLRYEEPIIYLANLRPASLDVTLGSESQSKVDDLKNIARDYLNRKRGDMLSEKAKGSLDNIIGRNEEKIKALATEYTYKFFETLPIYDVSESGAAGSLVSMALKDVRFTEDEAIVTLSPIKALLKILGIIAGMLLSILVALTFMTGGVNVNINVNENNRPE